MNTPHHRPSAAAASHWSAPRPDLVGTIAMLFGLALTGFNVRGETATDVAHFGAVGAGISIFLSFLADFRHGVRNLIRADLLALFSLYFLTLFEFLFAQDEFNLMITPQLTGPGVIACLWGFAGVAVGRHLVPTGKPPLRHLFTHSVTEKALVFALWICFSLGIFHMLFAVGFNPLEMIQAFMEPRFAQPWQRGRYGDWKALLVELGMLFYVIPPLAGIMLARRENYHKASLLMALLALAFLLFYAFSTGTRNVFMTYVITFLIAYALGVGSHRRKELYTLTTLCLAILMVSTVIMLQFRNMGLRNYIKYRYYYTAPKEQSVYVDNNLYSISLLVEAFPERYRYLGLEPIYLAIIRPIPRALWEGKPIGMSVTIEEIVGVGEEVTIAAAIVGEAFMMGGLAAVFLITALAGMAAGWWNRFATPDNSELGILIYASGFFAVVISMRSISVTTTAMLPTVACIAGAAFFIKRLDNRRRYARRAVPHPTRRAEPTFR